MVRELKRHREGKGKKRRDDKVTHIAATIVLGALGLL
jgi:hypothetical protein